MGFLHQVTRVKIMHNYIRIEHTILKNATIERNNCMLKLQLNKINIDMLILILLRILKAVHFNLHFECHLKLEANLIITFIINNYANIRIISCFNIILTTLMRLEINHGYNRDI